MYICAIVAILGAINTYLFIPRYGGADLEVEDDYLPLEHACLVPSQENMLLIKKTREARAMPYTMVEVIDTSFAPSYLPGQESDDFGYTNSAPSGYNTPPLDNRGALIGATTP